jgi:hypothetical protein
VLEDVSFIPELEKRSQKALYRGALALYELQRYGEAIDMLQILVQNFPESAPGRHELSRAQLRLAEQKTGNYDFTRIHKATKLRPPRIDCATFKGPIEIRETEGCGRGLFTIKPVKAGELLLCEKTFAYCFATPAEETKVAGSMSHTSIFLDVPAERVTLGTEADLIRNCSRKLARNPSLNSSFRDLYHGSYKAVPSVTSDGMAVVDT